MHERLKKTIEQLKAEIVAAPADESDVMLPMNAWVEAARALAKMLPDVAAATPEAPAKLLIPHHPDSLLTKANELPPKYPLGIQGCDLPYEWSEAANALYLIADMAEI